MTPGLQNIRRAGLAVAALLLLPSAQAASLSVVLADDTFEAGDPTEFSQVQSFDTPTVVGPTGPFATNSAEFMLAGDSSFELEQAEYLAGGYTQYGISFDLFTSDLLGSGSNFTIHTDTPTVRNLTFHGNAASGSVRVFSPVPGAKNRAVSTFSDGVIYHVDMFVDVSADLWEIRIDGNLVHSDMIGATDVESFRFALSGNPDSGARVYLDNVQVLATPLPPAALLFTSALAMLGWGKGKRGRNAVS